MSYGGMGRFGYPLLFLQIWISVVLLAALVSGSFGRFGSPLFFWQLLVSYEALGRSILSVFIVSGVG